MNKKPIARAQTMPMKAQPIVGKPGVKQIASVMKPPSRVSPTPVRPTVPAAAAAQKAVAKSAMPVRPTRVTPTPMRPVAPKPMKKK